MQYSQCFSFCPPLLSRYSIFHPMPTPHYLLTATQKEQDEKLFLNPTNVKSFHKILNFCLFLLVKNSMQHHPPTNPDWCRSNCPACRTCSSSCGRSVRGSLSLRSEESETHSASGVRGLLMESDGVVKAAQRLFITVQRERRIFSEKSPKAWYCGDE